MSSCGGACASVWPPLTSGGTAKAGPGVTAAKLGVTKRTDGRPELTYGGHPLYTYAGDQKPGDVQGQGLPVRRRVVRAGAQRPQDRQRLTARTICGDHAVARARSLEPIPRGARAARRRPRPPRAVLGRLLLRHPDHRHAVRAQLRGSGAARRGPPRRVERLPGHAGPPAVPVLGLAGIGLAAGSLAGLLLSERTGLFGFMEAGYRPAILLSIGLEATTIALLAVHLALRRPHGPRAEAGSRASVAQHS